MTPNRVNRMETQVKVNTSQPPCTCAARHQLRDVDVDQETRDALAPPCPHHAVPRSPEVLTEFLRAEVPCPHCEASPGTSCKWQGRRSVHLGRWVRAFAERKIAPRELEILAGLLPVVFTNATIIRAGAK